MRKNNMNRQAAKMHSTTTAQEPFSIQFLNVSWRLGG
jgi:hypothetical protein